MAEATHDEQVGAEVADGRVDRVPYPLSATLHSLEPGFDATATQPRQNLVLADAGREVLVVAERDQRHVRCAAQERQGVGERARGDPAEVPGHGDPLGGIAAVIVGHHDHRPPGLEDQALGDQPLAQQALLADAGDDDVRQARMVGGDFGCAVYVRAFGYDRGVDAVVPRGRAKGIRGAPAATGALGRHHVEVENQRFEVGLVGAREAEGIGGGAAAGIQRLRSGMQKHGLDRHGFLTPVRWLPVGRQQDK